MALIDLGADHPGMDGAPDFALQVRDGCVVTARLGVGFMHRGAEKLLESRDYRAGLALSDRHDWLGAACSEVGLAATIEAAAGIRVPARAALLRLLLCELSRVGHHLAFLAPLPGVPGTEAPDPGWQRELWAWREEVLSLVEGATGQRIHPMFAVVGGVRADVADSWLDQVAAAVPAWRVRWGDLLKATLEDVLTGYRGVGVLGRAAAVGFGASGQVARASGVDLDLRRDEAVLPYPPAILAKSGAVPVLAAGDARARVRCLADELPASLDLLAWGVEELRATPGPVNVRVPKVLRVPPGSHYGAFENPSGINGYLLVSRNEPMPYRCKIRSSGLNNAAALESVLPGTAVEAVPAVIASFFLLSGDIDR